MSLWNKFFQGMSKTTFISMSTIVCFYEVSTKFCFFHSCQFVTKFFFFTFLFCYFTFFLFWFCFCLITFFFWVWMILRLLLNIIFLIKIFWFLGNLLFFLVVIFVNRKWTLVSSACHQSWFLFLYFFITFFILRNINIVIFLVVHLLLFLCFY